MKIVFSDHAKLQNIYRKIPNKFILDTVNSPETMLDSSRGRKLRRRTFGDKILEVVTITEDDTLTIVTQYWLGE